MGALGLDAMTAHWEFAYGLDRLRALAGGLPSPVLAANCRDAEGGWPLPPFAIIDRAGMKIGVVGLAAVVAAHLLPPADRGQVELTIGDAAVRSLVPRLRREHGADLIVVLSHLGFPQDCKLAASVSGVDIILSGHTHHRLVEPAVVNDTIIMQAGAHATGITAVEALHRHVRDRGSVEPSLRHHVAIV